MICKKCGNSVPDGLTYCDYCGAKLNIIDETHKDATEHATTQEESELVYDTTVANPEIVQEIQSSAIDKIDKLIWHHVFCIGVIVLAIPNVMSVLNLIATGELVAALCSVISASWTIFSAITAIILLMKKAIGVKLIKIRSWIQLILGILGLAVAALAILFAGTIINDLIGAMVAGIFVAVVVILCVIGALENIIIAIINLKYYKKHQDLFVK